MQNATGEILLKFSRVCYKLNLITRKKFKLTAGELNCLIALYTEKPNSIKELTQTIGARSTTTSKILNSLEKKSFIKRNLSNTDKRIESVELTNSGILFSQEIVEFYKDIFSGISNFAGNEDFNFFLNFLNNLSFEASKNNTLQRELY